MKFLIVTSVYLIPRQAMVRVLRERSGRMGLRQRIKKPRYREDYDTMILGAESPKVSDSNESDVELEKELQGMGPGSVENVPSDDNEDEYRAEDDAAAVAEETAELLEEEQSQKRKKASSKGGQCVRKSLIGNEVEEGGHRRTKYKIADMSATEKGVVKQVDIIDYVQTVQKAGNNFREATVPKGTSKALLKCELNVKKQWKLAQDIGSSLKRWLKQDSIGFIVSTECAPAPVSLIQREIKKLGRPRKGVMVVKEKRKWKPKLEAIPSTSQKSEPVVEPISFDTLSIFNSRIINFEHVFAPGRTHSYQVSDVADELKRHASAKSLSTTNVLYEIAKRKNRKHSAQILFCGGPVSAVCVCPRRTSKGEELVVISTFADEKMLSFGPDDVAHVQFWSFPSDLSSAAGLEFLLEIGGASTILSMCWCPVFGEREFANNLPEDQKGASTSTNAKGSRALMEDTSVLGFLAVGTNSGQVLIYCIPKDLTKIKDLAANKDSAANLPLVVRASPAFALQHPNIAIKLLDDENQEVFLKKTPRKKKVKSEPVDAMAQESEEVKADRYLDMENFPIINIDWSPFLGGRLISAVSASGRVLVWDVESEEVNRPLLIFSAEWNSPPLSVAWISENNLAVSYRSKWLRIFDVHSEKCLYENQVAKNIGVLVTSCPSILPGLLSYDTSQINLLTIHYTCSAYISFDRDACDNVLIMPTFNGHQAQAFSEKVCKNTAMVGSVGADGRLICSLNGKVVPHDSDDEFPFAISKNVLHLISHRKNGATEVGANSNGTTSGNQEDQPTRTCFSHEDCCAHKWMEIRVGDAAVRDQLTMRRCKTKVPDVCIDRRLESLTSMDFSHMTPGLSVCGGDAGLCFITPSTL